MFEGICMWMYECDNIGDRCKWIIQNDMKPIKHLSNDASEELKYI